MLKEITIKELDKLLWSWDSKNVLVSLPHPFVHNHVLDNFSSRFYPDTIYIDGDHSMASGIYIPIKNLLSIHQEENEVMLSFKETFVTLSVLEGKFKDFCKNAMLKKWYGKDWRDHR